jgi:hypothetical protein
LRRGQRQSGGADSTNVQAGQDVVIHVGVTAAEARTIALDVFEANLIKLSGVAEQTARDRAERITREYLRQLEERSPAGLESIRDPDMLQAVYNAQQGYARSGEEDLEAALVDLLVERSGQKERDLKCLVLNEAIAILPKLSGGQRRAITACFLIRFISYMGPFSLQAAYEYINDNLAPFADIVMNKRADYLYMHAAGAGSPSALTLTVADAFSQSLFAFFTDGFPERRVPPPRRTLLDDTSIFVPCLRNPKNWQINARSVEEVKRLQIDKGIADNLLLNLYREGLMSLPAIREDVVSHIPVMQGFMDHWDSSGLSNFELTAVGITIGHAYWRSFTGQSTPLDIWLS